MKAKILEILLNLIPSIASTIWEKINPALLLKIVCIVIAFGSGFWVAKLIYQTELTQFKTQIQSAAAKSTAAALKKERENARLLAAVIGERDTALANVDSLIANLDSVRKLADSYKRRLSAAGTDTGQPYREKLSRCVDLLAESANLLNEGSILSKRIAIDKDALADLVGQ